MNFSVSKSDNSFYFHFYDDVVEKVKLPKTPLENRNDGKIDFSDYVETDFKRNKISFHKSGYIHSTDKLGNRLRDGIIGFSFNEIEISKLVLICAPKKIEYLNTTEKIRESTDIIIHLPKEIKPFTIHFDVYRNTRDKELDISNPNLLFGGFIMVTFPDQEYGLRIYAQKVLGRAIWPPFNIILTRIRNNSV